jgi:hypothetical protein
MGLRTLANRKAWRTRFYGPDDPRTIRAGRELAAAHLALALANARAAGLDDLDIAAVTAKGELAPEAVAA